MLRGRNGAERGQAASFVGLTDVGGSPARLVVTGRPLLRTCAGALALGEPVCAEAEGARFVSLRPWSRNGCGVGEGNPNAILAPALSDSHLHVVAAASARTALDLAVDPPRDLAALFDRLRAHAAGLGRDDWLRVRGFDEFPLAERRMPTTAELDAAVPRVAIRLRHATLHASVLSTGAILRLDRALQRLAVANDGLLVGHEEELTSSVAPRDEVAIAEAMRSLGEELASSGIACIEDITASNDAARVRLLAEAVEDGSLPQRVRVWLRDANEAEAAHAASRGLVEIAGVKLLPTREEDTRADAFRSAVARARARGLPVAVHAVEPDVIGGALDALEAAPARAGSRAAPDRLEHCSLCPPLLVERLAASGVAVVTQPGFLVARGPKYRREVEAPLWPWLYPIGSLRRAGVLVAAGSDAPVIAPDPRLAFAGATTRRSSDGAVLGEGEAITEADALDLCTTAAARVRGEGDAHLPWLRVGARADLALLKTDPTKHGLASWSAQSTIIGGRVRWGEDS